MSRGGERRGYVPPVEMGVDEGRILGAGDPRDFLGASSQRRVQEMDRNTLGLQVVEERTARGDIGEAQDDA